MVNVSRMTVKNIYIHVRLRQFQMELFWTAFGGIELKIFILKGKSCFMSGYGMNILHFEIYYEICGVNML